MASFKDLCNLLRRSEQQPTVWNGNILPQTGFDLIVGHDDVKDIVQRALDSQETVNLLLIGPPASAKTLFLEGIAEESQDCLYFDGTNTTNKIFDELNLHKPSVICIDELEKMKRNYQNQLLNFAEDGRVRVVQHNRQFDFDLKCKIFATANDVKKISEPLLSRFAPVVMDAYSEEEFVSIAERLLPHLCNGTAEYIAREVFKVDSDIRRVRAIGRLVRMQDRREDIKPLIAKMLEY